MKLRISLKKQKRTAMEEFQEMKKVGTEKSKETRWDKYNNSKLQ